MKRIAIVLVVLLLVPLIPGSASAAERGIRRYLAEASDGRYLRFRTVLDDGRRRLDAVFLGASRSENAVLTCDDGTTQVSSTQGWTQWPWYFEGRTVAVEEWHRGHNSALHIEGTFGPSSASGTFRYTEVSINVDHTPRLCSTGDLTWTAERTN